MITDTEVNDFIAHFGKKGMKWGVRKQQAGAAIKTQLPGNSNKRDVKIASKMSKGEKVASFMVGGPIGMLAFKGGRIALAKRDLAKNDLKTVTARRAAVKVDAKMTKGEKIASALVFGPVGAVAYKSMKVVSARASNEIKNK